MNWKQPAIILLVATPLIGGFIWYAEYDRAEQARAKEMASLLSDWRDCRREALSDAMTNTPAATSDQLITSVMSVCRSKYVAWATGSDLATEPMRAWEAKDLRATADKEVRKRETAIRKRQVAALIELRIDELKREGVTRDEIVEFVLQEADVPECQ